MTFISETNWSLLKKLLTKNLGYIFGVWRMLHPTRTEVIPEVFLKPRATREDVLEDCWQVWREGLCILCCFLTLWELVPGYMYVFEVCTGSLGYESLTAKWIPKPWEHGPNHGPRAVRMLAIVCKMLAIVCRVGLEGKEVHWPNGKEASGLGKNIVIQLSFRIALTSCICLISKVPGHDPVWWEFCCENLDHSHYGKRCCLIVERFLQSAICYRPAILPLTALKKN